MDALTEINEWLRKTGMKESRLGMLACANPKVIDRIRDGTAQVASLNAVLAYIRVNKAKK